jgi:hypothetical protein
VHDASLAGFFCGRIAASMYFLPDILQFWADCAIFKSNSNLILI